MNNDYIEKLRKQGYTEEEIKIELDRLSKINLSSEPLGSDRNDKGVTVEDSKDHEMKTSSLMLGKKLIELENGQYVSEEEIIRALNESMSTVAANQIIICKKTGKRIDDTQLSDLVLKASKRPETISLHGKSDKITNQDSAKITIEKNKKAILNGILMLGNKGLELPNGPYILLADIKKAIDDYIIMTPTKQPAPPVLVPQEPVLPEEKEIVKVVSRTKTPLSLRILPIILSTIALLATFGFKIDKPITIPEIYKTISSIQYEAVGCQLSSHSLTIEDYIYDEANKSFIEIGQSVKAEAGITYHESSDYKYGGANDYGSFGGGIRKAGEYNVDYISVLHQGQIKKVATKEGQNLADVMTNLALELDVPLTELEPMIHLGGPVSGWVSVKDLITSKQKEPKDMAAKVILDESEKYTGTIDDYKGGPITITTKDGQLLVPLETDITKSIGTVVQGTDGKEYQITDLKLIQEEVLVAPEGKTKWRVSWSVDNITAKEALAAAALGIASGLLIGDALDKKKKETEAIPVTKSELPDPYKEAFKVAQERYNQQSKFTKIMDKIKGKTPDWNKISGMIEAGDITLGEIEGMYGGPNGGKL